mgnify:CR=1 FL=1
MQTKRLLPFLLLAFLLAGTPAPARAQITYTYADLEARMGQTFDASFYSATDLTGAGALVALKGANQTWDFTTMPFQSDGTGSQTYHVLPANLPGAAEAQAKGATFAIESQTNQDSTVWVYDKADAGAYYNIGYTYTVGHGGDEVGGQLGGTARRGQFREGAHERRRGMDDRDADPEDHEKTCYKAHIWRRLRRARGPGRSRRPRTWPDRPSPEFTTNFEDSGTGGPPKRAADLRNSFLRRSRRASGRSRRRRRDGRPACRSPHTPRCRRSRGGRG